MLDAILKILPLGMFFRGIWPGVFFLVSFFVAKDGWKPVSDKVFKFNGENVLSVWLPAAMFFGTTVYVFHRTVVYPWIEWILTWGSMVRLRTRIPLISKNVI